MVEMYADAKVSPQQFNETYRGKPFAASGTFSYAEQDYSRYEISLLDYAYFVTCRTSDVTTVALAKQLIAGFPVKVSGLIDDMGDRTLTCRDALCIGRGQAATRDKSAVVPPDRPRDKMAPDNFITRNLFRLSQVELAHFERVVFPADKCYPRSA